MGSSEAVPVHAGEGHTTVSMAAEMRWVRGAALEQGATGRTKPLLCLPFCCALDHFSPRAQMCCAESLALVAQSGVYKDLELRQQSNTLHTEIFEK